MPGICAIGLAEGLATGIGILCMCGVGEAVGEGICIPGMLCISGDAFGVGEAAGICIPGMRSILGVGVGDGEAFGAGVGDGIGIPCRC